MIQFLRYFTGVFIRPRPTLRALLRDPRRVGYGFLGAVILAVVYFTGITISIALHAAHLPKFLVINIPADQYYSCERFFILPVGLAGIILASGAARLAARKMNGRGVFEDLFALLGFSMVMLAVVMGIPDLVLGILAGNNVLAPPGWEFAGLHVWLGTAWYLLLTILSIREAERLPWRGSIAVGLIGFLANGAVSFIFIR
jgi:hypothetical protein